MFAALALGASCALFSAQSPWPQRWAKLEGATWIRLQRSGAPDVYPETRIDVFANRKCVKTRVISTGYIDYSLKPQVRRTRSGWMLFFASGTGAGSTWKTTCLAIERPHFAFTSLTNFEHGYPDNFDRTCRFVELHYMKYDNHADNRSRFAFQRITWRWDDDRRQFVYISSRFVGRTQAEARRIWKLLA
ncbi:MAG TPA: hypothetical protein VKT78_19585 [Fimbriimonadaceae bacterium]|nr:hypothetical protein [Fimbriimonadaceae bacterium]